ncbi:MAG: hypothetical protein Q9174_004641, partial [Haloplaca sp. 1 TL-2023]
MCKRNTCEGCHLCAGFNNVVQEGDTALTSTKISSDLVDDQDQQHGESKGAATNPIDFNPSDVDSL